MSWGGKRLNAGRHQVFNIRVGKVVYLDKSELDELNRIVEIESQMEGRNVSASSILRELAVEWIEEKRRELRGILDSEDSGV